MQNTAYDMRISDWSSDVCSSDVGVLEIDIDQADIPSWKYGPPQSILLATDLSFRCERALNRAAALSAHWQSALVVLHVLDTSDLNLIEPGHRPSWHP